MEVTPPTMPPVPPVVGHKMTGSPDCQVYRAGDLLAIRRFHGAFDWPDAFTHRDIVAGLWRKAEVWTAIGVPIPPPIPEGIRETLTRNEVAAMLGVSPTVVRGLMRYVLPTLVRGSATVVHRSALEAFIDEPLREWPDRHADPAFRPPPPAGTPPVPDVVAGAESEAVEEPATPPGDGTAAVAFLGTVAMSFAASVLEADDVPRWSARLAAVEDDLGARLADGTPPDALARIVGQVAGDLLRDALNGQRRRFLRERAAVVAPHANGEASS